MTYGKRKERGTIAKAVLWMLLEQCVWTLLFGISKQQLTDAAAHLAAGPTDTAEVRKGREETGSNFITQLLTGGMMQQQPTNIKEDFIKLKRPNSYMPDPQECILGQASYHLQGWLMANATINHANAELHGKYVDLSYSTTDIRRHIVRHLLDSLTTEYVSLAHRNMSTVPYEELSIVNNTLQYLSLAGNHLQAVQFPQLKRLRVLDIRNCGLMLLEYGTFASVANLEQLYLSHNYLLQITAAHLQPLAALRHLDLAYNTNGQSVYYETYMSLEVPEPDPYTSLTEGLELSENVFDPLERLQFLDLSHTKLLPISARAFRNLAVEHLSLCYTGISIIVGTMMYGKLRALDISGNPGITAAIHHVSGKGDVRGLHGNIEVLACENASVKYLDWVEGMVNLRVLLLSHNSINQLSNKTFATLGRLEVLDLSANHISNWYWRIFAHNPQLAVLDLSANNLNVLTTEMLSDFEYVRFLAIGNNNFMCHCLLRELIDMAKRNSEGICLIRNLGQYYLQQENFTTGIRTVGTGGSATAGFGGYATIEDYIRATSEAHSEAKNGTKKVKIRTRGGFTSSQMPPPVMPIQILPCSNANGTQEGPGPSQEDPENVQLIQLIDYDPDSYKCRDLENDEYNFDEQEKCTFDRAALEELFFDNFNNTSSTVIKFVIIFVGFALVAFIIYVSKWDYVKYFCITLRNATILSIMRHKSEDLHDKSRDRRLSTGSGSFMYDVFVSYSEHDRQWILDELLPNLERSEDITVCLHERDFKVGVSILENIIHCMDQSRTLLLVVSECFLLSHWCQFEMHLAQHRLLETRREHLILVFLEDIPKIKRPRTLQYLMKTKTYIKWPTTSVEPANQLDDARRTKSIWKFCRKNRKPKPTEDNIHSSSSSTTIAERQLFWTRLKKAIHEGITWEPENTVTSSFA